MEFPRLVYRSPSTHKAVTCQEEHDSALNEGWFASVPDAAKDLEKKAIEKQENQVKEEVANSPLGQEAKLKFDKKAGKFIET